MRKITYWAATDFDGRCFLYSRKPVRNNRLGVWMQGKTVSDDEGFGGVIGYDIGAGEWEDEPYEVEMCELDHLTRYYRYTGNASKAKQAQARLIVALRKANMIYQ